MEALKKALLEMGRLIVLALIPLAIPMVYDWAIDWKILAVIAIVTLLRGVDKFLYKTGSKREEKGTARNPITSKLTGGLVRF